MLYAVCLCPTRRAPGLENNLSQTNSVTLAENKEEKKEGEEAEKEGEKKDEKKKSRSRSPRSRSHKKDQVLSLEKIKACSTSSIL